jgi:peroxiredoxin family protein
LTVSESLSLVLFSGTDDKLESAATVIAGAAALGKSVNVLLQFWGLDAFRADHFGETRGLASDAGAAGRGLAPGHARLLWAETLRQAKELGDVRIQACSGSLDALGLDAGELDAIVDGPCGIASFLLAAEDGPILFI